MRFHSDVKSGRIGVFRNSGYYSMHNGVDQIKVDKIDAFC